MNIVDKRIEDLIPYEKNPRRNDKAVKYVAESIKQFGFKVPIVIDKDNVIVAGHTRYKASKKLGLKTVPCLVADDLTEQQIKAYRLADNKVAEKAEWDFELLDQELADLFDFNMMSLGFEDDEEEDEPEVFEDGFEPEIPKTPKAKPGDIYQLGNHRLMCGDSTKDEDVRQLMNGKLADLVVTDPPYNVDYGSKAEAINKYGYNFSDRHIENDYMPQEQFIAFLDNAFRNLSESLKPGGAFYIWHASITIYEFETALRLNNLKSRQQLIWNKNAIVLGRQDYQWKHEPCLYGWKEGAAHYFVDDRKQTTVIEDKGIEINKLSKDEMKQLLKQIFSDKTSTTIINEDKPHNSVEHPTMKPLKLLERHVKNSSKPNELVLDLFGGSGSTMMTCEQLNRTCYMMEFDPKYVDVIIQRWENFTDKKAVKLKGAKQ